MTFVSSIEHTQERPLVFSSVLIPKVFKIVCVTLDLEPNCSKTEKHEVIFLSSKNLFTEVPTPVFWCTWILHNDTIFLIPWVSWNEGSNHPSTVFLCLRTDFPEGGRFTPFCIPSFIQLPNIWCLILLGSQVWLYLLVHLFIPLFTFVNVVLRMIDYNFFNTVLFF